MLIRKMKETDREEVLGMMKVFYSTDAVEGDYPEDVFERDFSDCVGECPLITGFIFDEGGQTAGYAMAAMSYSTEEGGPCVWIEDLYVKESYRGCGFAEQFFAYMEEIYGGTARRIRLEVAPGNETARKVYERCGYTVLEYEQRKKSL